MNDDIARGMVEVKRDGLDYKVMGENSVLVCVDNIINKARTVTQISEYTGNVVNAEVRLSSMLNGSLHRGCINLNCNIKDRCSYRCSPNGNSTSDIMVVKAMPTETELYTRNAFTDSAGIAIREVITRLGVNDAYYTTMLKCANVQGILPESVKECVYRYFLQEVCDIVKPELIIFCGQKTVMAAKKYELMPQFSPQKLMSGEFRIQYSSPVSGSAHKVRATFLTDFINDNNPPSVERELNRLMPILKGGSNELREQN